MTSSFLLSISTISIFSATNFCMSATQLFLDDNWDTTSMQIVFQSESSDFDISNSIRSVVQHEQQLNNSNQHDEGGIRLLWLPYLLLTVFLISLLLASFIHFHIKYRDRYVQRHILRKEITRSALLEDIEAATAATASVAAGATMFNHLPLSATRLLSQQPETSNINYTDVHLEPTKLRKQKTRLKMLYDNKVDVISIVENSLLTRTVNNDKVTDTSDNEVPSEDAEQDRKYKLFDNK